MKNMILKTTFAMSLIGILIFIGSLALAITEEEIEPVTVDGDKVEYFQAEKKVVAEGNVSATYKDMKLTCRKATVYTDTKLVQAEGDVTLTHENGVFKGEKVTYNFETKKASLENLSMKEVGLWYGGAKTGQKYADKSYLIEDGYITTCDLEEPHYKLESKRIKIYLDDKIVAKNVILKVKNTPLMYLPYYSHPLNDNRPRVTIIPGHSSDWGYYLLTAWRYEIPSLGTGRIHLDQRQLKGFASGIDTNYTLPGDLGDGKLRLYYTHEHDKVPPGNIPAETWRERYRAQLKHKATFSGNYL